MANEVWGMAKNHPGWRPDLLRQQREKHGLTLEATREELHKVVRRAKIDEPAAHPSTLSQHESGEVYPGPPYRRAYCLLYGATEPALGFRNALPGEETRFDVTPLPEQRNGSHVLAVERALTRIGSGGEGSDHYGWQQRVMEAWKRRHTGGDPHSPCVVLVGGFAGSGKTEFARFLTQLTGWPLVDKDPLTRPLVEQLLMALGSHAHDRHTEVYREKVRPAEYAALMQAVYANVQCRISTVVTAPFIAEMSDEQWMQRLINKCQAQGVDVAPIWVQCDVDSMHEYISSRGAARDSWKLERWEEYLATIDVELRPVVPHLVVDNRMGTAISLADQARHALGTVSV